MAQSFDFKIRQTELNIELSAEQLRLKSIRNKNNDCNIKSTESSSLSTVSSTASCKDENEPKIMQSLEKQSTMDSTRRKPLVNVNADKRKAALRKILAQRNAGLSVSKPNKESLMVRAPTRDNPTKDPRKKVANSTCVTPTVPKFNGISSTQKSLIIRSTSPKLVEKNKSHCLNISTNSGTLTRSNINKEPNATIAVDALRARPEEPSSTPTSSNEDQKALLRKVLAKSQKRRSAAATKERKMSPRSSTINGQQKLRVDKDLIAPQSGRNEIQNGVQNSSEQCENNASYQFDSKDHKPPLHFQSGEESRHEKLVSSRTPGGQSAQSSRRESFPIQKGNSTSSRNSTTFNRIDQKKLRRRKSELDDDGSYSSFINVLQKEVRTDHNELWCSFRSLFCESAKDTRKREKRVKFDKETTETLRAINLHLKRASVVECKDETQLVTDKKFNREAKKLDEKIDFAAKEREARKQNTTLSYEQTTTATTTTFMEKFEDENSEKKCAKQINEHRKREEQRIYVGGDTEHRPLRKGMDAGSPTKSEIREISSPMSGRKRRINFSEAVKQNSSAPPWGSLPLKSIRLKAQVNNDPDKSNKETEAPQWLNVQRLKSNHRNISVYDNSTDNVDTEKLDTRQQNLYSEGGWNETNETEILKIRRIRQGCAADETCHSVADCSLAPTKPLQTGRCDLDKNPQTVTSFVPNNSATTKDGSAPWAKVKLRQGRPRPENAKTDKKASAPWSAIVLKKREFSQDNRSLCNEENPRHDLFESTKSDREGTKDEESNLNFATRDGNGTAIELSDTPSENLEQDAAGNEHCTNIRLGDRNKQVQKSEIDVVPVSKASQSEIKNALANMLASRQGKGVPIKQKSPCEDLKADAEDNEDDTNTSVGEEYEEIQKSKADVLPVSKPSQSEIKNALANMLASRQGKGVSIKQNTPCEDPKVDAEDNVDDTNTRVGEECKESQKSKVDESPVSKPAQSEIKNALANMLASRQGAINLQRKKSPKRDPKIMSEENQDTKEKKYDSIIKVGDEIDLSNLTSDLQRELQEFILFGLWHSPETLDEFVVLGYELLLITKSSSANQSNQCVICIYQREKIKSINLDMAENVADLTLIDESHKVLRFKNAGDCLKFAASFYQAPTPTLSRAPSSSQNMDVESNIESMSQAEKLSPEEQELLMKYREVRKSKGIDDAVKETIGVREVGGRQEVSNLSDKDRNAVEKYKKMLKMQVPTEAVQHKMTKDGASQSVMDAVLSKNDGDKSNSGTTPFPNTNKLTEKERLVANSYLKMLKVLIPKEAVEHKMKKDGVEQKIINLVLNTNDPIQSQVPNVEKINLKPKLSEEEEKLVMTYKKMLKMCIPTEAVRHKMKKDKATSNVILAVFPEDIKSTNGSSKVSNGLTEEEQNCVNSYQKMLKMGIPLDGVRHKMMKDGVDQKLVGFVFGEESERKESEADLSDEESKAVAIYKKMLKMHLPEEAVRHKMSKEKASERVIAAVFGMNRNGVKGNQSSRNKPTLKGSKLVALHWTPLSDEDVDKSVWKTKKKRKMAQDSQPGTNDISKLVELFKKKSNNTHGPGNISSSSSKSGEKASLIDLNRANNVAISLKAFKDFTHKELADTISTLDPQEKITGERVQFMKDILPNAKEVQAIKAFKGEDSRLVPAEIFFRHIVNVPRVEAKVDIMQTMATFCSNAQDLANSYNTLERACTQVQNSEKLQSLLDMVLHIGNIMNEGTRTGGAAGFKFDSLLKLTQTKSSDGKTTVLDYLVMMFIAKDMRETLHLNQDFLDCQEGSRMLLGDMNTETKATIDGLTRCKKELENLKKENGMITEAEKTMKPSPPVDARAHLLAAIKSRGGGDLPKERLPPTRGEAFGNYLEAIKAKEKKTDLLEEKREELKKEESFSTALAEAKRPLTIDGGIQRLQHFITEAEAALTNLKKKKDAGIAACRDLAQYCGEKGGEQAASPLLAILSQFGSNLDEAVKKYDKKLERESKKKLRKEQNNRRQHIVDSSVSSNTGNLKGNDSNKSAGEVTTDPEKTNDSSRETESDFTKSSEEVIAQNEERYKAKTSSRTRDGSLVFMVNEMLNKASLKTRRDFEKGIVYDDAEDDALKAIYERERTSNVFACPETKASNVVSNADLLNSIRARRLDD